VSTNLINWTVDYGSKNFTNTSSGAYFSHISATKNYIAYAYVSNETTNVSTQRIAYKNSTSAWVEIDTGIPEVSGEDHCNVVALNDNEMFLVETSARFNIYSPSLWLFNATSGSLARIITFDNMAYNDRTVGIDQTTNCIYVPNNEWDASATSTAKIANISLGFPLFNMADYMNNYVITFNITASHDAHSSITPDDVTAANKGADQSYSFSAITGYHITDVVIDNIPQIITSNHTFTNVQTTHTIAVTSAINSYDITASSDGHSTITPNGATSVDYGNSQFYSYSASTGYSIQSVTVDGISVSITGNYTFSNVQTTHTIAVTSTINGNMSSINLAISDIRV